jgi:hypothetical protein
MIKKYAFVAEGDVFMTIEFDDSNPKAEAWVAGLASSPLIIDITDNESKELISGGWTWVDGVFAQPSLDQ